MPDDPALFEALYRISSILGSTDDPKSALEAMIDEILRVIPATSASINLINPDSQVLEIEVLRGLPEHSKQLQLSLGQGVTGWVALHGKPLLVPDVREDQRYVTVRDTIRSEMAAPMTDRGAIIGVINLDSDNTAAFTARDLERLERLSNEATRVICRIWQLQRLHGKAQQLQALVNTTSNLVARLEMGDLLSTITEEALAITGCRLCALFLYDPGRQRLNLETLAGSHSVEDYSESLQLEESAIGTAIRRRRQVEVPDLPRSEEHHFVDVVQNEGLVSMLSTPLMFEDQVVGVLNLYTAQRHRFSNSERTIVAALAGISALAILNARLYRRVFESEETLRRNDRLTTLGLLSAEIAHEIRNPLTVIMLLFGSLGLEFDEEDMRRRDVEIIAEKLDQLEGIVTRVLSFGKSSEGLHSRWNLQQLVEDTLHLVRLKLQQGGVHMIYHRPEPPMVVEASKGQLQQALLNLIINATQAMPQGGVIQVTLFIETREGQEQACISVSDTGPGIPPEISERLFDSFLADKAKGNGLGLNIVKRIMKSHSGDVEIAVTGPAGTTMKMWLPVAE